MKLLNFGWIAGLKRHPPALILFETMQFCRENSLNLYDLRGGFVEAPGKYLWLFLHILSIPFKSQVYVAPQWINIGNYSSPYDASIPNESQLTLHHNNLCQSSPAAIWFVSELWIHFKKLDEMLYYGKDLVMMGVVRKRSQVNQGKALGDLWQISDVGRRDKCDRYYNYSPSIFWQNGISGFNKIIIMVAPVKALKIS